MEGLPQGRKPLTVSRFELESAGVIDFWVYLSNNEVVLWAHALVPVGVCANSGIFWEAVQ